MKRNIWAEVKEYIKTHKVLSVIMFMILFFVYATLFNMISADSKDIEEITYNEFLSYMENGDIDTVYYNKTAEYMTITLLNDDTKDMTRKERNEYTYSKEYKRKVLYPAYDEFRKDVLESDTNIRVVDNSSFMSTALSAIGSVGIYILLIIFMMRMMNGMTKGPSEKEIIQTSDVTFDDIIGHEEIIDDVKFITELIKDPTKGDKIGAKLPKGILFAGQPGTGKTLLAKAIAHEAGVPFLYQNASGLIEMYVGLGARRVRELFKLARKNAPCIIFIDEIDAIGGKRENSKGTAENEQTINALLQEMDGFKARDGIFIIAATNRPESLDDALVRSGRFDRQIDVNPPKDWMVRKELFEHYLSKFTVDKNVDIDNLAKQVSGFTGADIAMVCNEASIVAVMADKDCIDTDCIEEAIDKKIFKGNRSKTGTHGNDRKIVAYHESGHAVMSIILGEPIARASIQSTISGVGGAVFNQDKDTVFMTDKDLKNRILIAYAGRASEEIKFDSVTTGANNDITQATQVMLQYVEHQGFDSEFGLLDIAVLGKEHLLDGRDITAKLSKMSNELYAECKDLLEKNYDKVEKLALKLLDVETLSGEEIERLFAE
jgi:cell division protease FtsH